MQQIIKYSGAIVVLLAWTCLIFPYIFSNNRDKFNTISELSKDHTKENLLKFGVVFAGFFQILFAYYLFKTIANSLAGVGGFIFTLGSVSFLLAGLISHKSDSKKHSNLIRMYFLLMALGTLILSFSIAELSLNMSLLATSTVLIMVSGAASFYFSKQFIKSEIWTIALSNIWALVVYVTLLK